MAGPAQAGEGKRQVCMGWARGGPSGRRRGPWHGPEREGEGFEPVVHFLFKKCFSFPRI